jgi:hypothetical protein
MQQVCLAQSTLLLFPLWPVCGRGEVAVSSLNISVGCNRGSRISVISVGSALVGKHDYAWHAKTIPTRGNLFLPVRLLVWADGRGTVAQADNAARAELQGAPKQKLLKQKHIRKCHWVKHKKMLICCLDVSPDMQLLWQ